MFTTPTFPTEAPTATPVRADDNPWLLWRPAAPAEAARLTIAELAECHCPELCDRDHDNE
jgi:hypothetical protein